ncbi:NADPH:quinone reductase [Subtercola boreus]|uniref:NADPH:quinone reductase n=1 Tax=Subtercola boreus TaxID=120213 RepID=A0A3E0VNX7_9MICO|nr:NADP-dependent oxidoreductase [Subtercola boreus]RFA11385.1 NADPH:quinone reductase [Subtercola boreus]TQL55489.1 NADPH:quinone reductase-like Zn-dependent oxidoreductase [Subtercola boreus]
MRAIRYDTYGGPEVLQQVEVEVPTPKPDEVLVAVRFAAVNPFDLKLRSGAMEGMVKVAFPVTPGSEIAGVVTALGAEVADSAELAVGDEVFGWATSGGYAEFATAAVVARRPQGLREEIAAALPVAGEAALRGLRLLGLSAGETLLVHGAAGAVGSLAVQLAVARGVTVIGTCSEKDAEAVRELGAHPVRYGDGVFERVRELAPEGVDAVLDAAGAGDLPGSIDLVGGTERVITLADPAAYGLGVTFSSGGRRDQTPDALRQLADAALSGALVLPPARHLPLAEAAEAHRLVAAGGQRGKVLLDT